MNTKQIIMIIVVIFFAFVGYKLISSNIQENKEKAVLREKAQLQELAQEPLNKCIDDINSNATYDIKQMKESAKEISSNYLYCITSGHGPIVDAQIKSGQVTINDYCTFTSQEQDAEEQKIKEKAKIDIQECYKRYK